MAELIPLLAEPMEIMISREERFAKTAVGWILREIYRHEPDMVTRFLKQHKKKITTDVFKNALKYMDKIEMKKYK